MRPYELMTVLAPDVPEDELTPAIDEIASYVTRYGGTIIAVNRDSPWGRRRLAYPIRYQSRDVRDGFYVLWYFDAEPEAIAEIDREIRLNDTIIRHLTIALDKPFVPAPPPEEARADAEEAAPAANAIEAVPAAEVPEAETAHAAEAEAPQEETAPAAEAEAPEAEEFAQVAETEEATVDNVADEAPAAEPAAETAE